jgi:uncharacterized protein (TIGR03437 family)
LAFTAGAGGYPQIQYMQVQNLGGGLLDWTISTVYKSGDGWLRVYPTWGFNTTTVQVSAMAEKLAQGTYQATLKVDAGPLAGTRSYDVSFVVTAPVAGPGRPTIAGVANAAVFGTGPVVAGSLATLMGLRLAGQKVTVTFDDLPAAMLFDNATQINVQVPAALGARNSALVVVNVDGASSLPFAVALADTAPGIFAGGILNQDNSVNGASAPAAPGSTIQVFLTGLLSPQVVAVMARIADRNIAFPSYFGPAPGTAGLQQVNLVLPADLSAMTTQVYVCGLTVARPESPICSPPAPLVIGRK